MPIPSHTVSFLVFSMAQLLDARSVCDSVLAQYRLQPCLHHGPSKVPRWCHCGSLLTLVSTRSKPSTPYTTQASPGFTNSTPKHAYLTPWLSVTPGDYWDSLVVPCSTAGPELFKQLIHSNGLPCCSEELQTPIRCFARSILSLRRMKARSSTVE